MEYKKHLESIREITKAVHTEEDSRLKDLRQKLAEDFKRADKELTALAALSKDAAEILSEINEIDWQALRTAGYDVRIDPHYAELVNLRDHIANALALPAQVEKGRRLLQSAHKGDVSGEFQERYFFETVQMQLRIEGSAKELAERIARAKDEIVKFGESVSRNLEYRTQATAAA
jgi:hypothetical protein